MLICGDYSTTNASCAHWYLDDMALLRLFRENNYHLLRQIYSFWKYSLCPQRGSDHLQRWVTHSSNILKTSCLRGFLQKSYRMRDLNLDLREASRKRPEFDAATRKTIITAWLVCTMAMGIRAASINRAFPIEFELVCCRLRIDGKIMQELCGLRRDFTTGPNKSEA